MKHRLHARLLLALAILAAMSLARPAPAEESPAKPAADPATKWESEVRAYEKKDQESPPPAGAILFVGSSTIRMWQTLEKDFAPLKVIGRGIGGCTVPDLVYYADRVVIAYKPQTVVFYAGDNDVASKTPAEKVAQDFKAFVEKVRKALPAARILFISIKPSPSRARVWDEAKKANQFVREFLEKTPNAGYVDTAQVLMDAQGKPRPELFRDDMLHMNAKGYELWVPVLKAALERALAPAEPKK